MNPNNYNESSVLQRLAKTTNRTPEAFKSAIQTDTSKTIPFTTKTFSKRKQNKRDKEYYLFVGNELRQELDEG